MAHTSIAGQMAPYEADPSNLVMGFFFISLGAACHIAMAQPREAKK